VGLLKALFGAPNPPARPYLDQGLALTKKLIGLLGLSDWASDTPQYTPEEMRAIDQGLRTAQRTADQVNDARLRSEIIDPMRRIEGAEALHDLAGRHWGISSECPDDWRERISTYLKAWAMQLDPDVLLDMSVLLAIAGCRGEAITAAQIVANHFPSYAPRYFGGTADQNLVAQIVASARETVLEISNLPTPNPILTKPQPSPVEQRGSARPHVASTSSIGIISPDPALAAGGVAELIGQTFSAANFCDFVAGQKFSSDWTIDDGLAVWHFFGTLVVDVAVWTTVDPPERCCEIIDRSHRHLSRQWRMSDKVLARFNAIRQDTTAIALDGYTTCKTDADLRIYFSRCVNRIFGSELPFKGLTVDLILNGQQPKTLDAALGADFGALFTQAIASAKELIRDSVAL
jgi:hypothetical protein